MRSLELSLPDEVTSFRVRDGLRRRELVGRLISINEVKSLIDKELHEIIGITYRNGEQVYRAIPVTGDWRKNVREIAPRDATLVDN